MKSINLNNYFLLLYRLYKQLHMAYDINNKTGILGKTYVGSGNYLYQLNNEGYYYYDSKLNAASYNQSEQRFYVYDYLGLFRRQLKKEESLRTMCRPSDAR